MRRIGTIIAVVLTLVLYVYGQPPQGNSNRRVTKTRKPKALVKKLPEGLEGVELKDGVIKLKPGYKFVKKSGNSVTVARMAGGDSPQAGNTGSFSCSCTDEFTGGSGGGCSLHITSNTLRCQASEENPCKGGCILNTTINGVKKGVIIY